MKMTWLHMEFVLIFITGPSRTKLGRTALQQLLTLASLIHVVLWIYVRQKILRNCDVKTLKRSTLAILNE